MPGFRFREGSETRRSQVPRYTLRSMAFQVDAQLRSLAKARKLSANRILVELIESGMEVEKRKQEEFFKLAERCRSTTDPKEANRLGDQLGRMVFGG